ncbi:MAG: GTP cyclohydrolase I FolE [Bacteroidota bacterium]
MKPKIITLNIAEKQMNFRKIEENVKSIITEIGEDTERQGLLKTPERVALAYKHLTRGYSQTVEQVINGAIFDEKYDEMVIVKDIDFYSLCEHHMLPFYGKVHIAYIPNGKIVGLSKLPRIVDLFARRLQVQERMTQQIADTIDKYLDPIGVAVVSDAYHMCMMMRGVEKQNSTTTSSAMHGIFKEDARTRSEFLELLSHRRI